MLVQYYDQEPVTLNQMLYLTDKKCRNNPTSMPLVELQEVYEKVFADWLKSDPERLKKWELATPGKWELKWP